MRNRNGFNAAGAAPGSGWAAPHPSTTPSAAPQQQVRTIFIIKALLGAHMAEGLGFEPRRRFHA